MILQALSLSLPKSPSFLVTLQALVAKVTTTLSLSLSDSPGSLCQSHQTFLSSDSPVTLQALFAKVTTTLYITTNLTYNATANHLTCSSVVDTYFLRSPLLSGTPSPIPTTYLIQHWIPRYFNHPVLCGTFLIYAHASHKPVSAIRLPNP